MITNKGFFEIKNALCIYFGSPATVEKLSEPHGTKTIKEAKLVGVFIASRIGHDNKDIAVQFGYSAGNSVGNAISRARKLYEEDLQFSADARAVAEKLSIVLGA